LILHEPRNKDKHGRINRIVNLLDVIPTLADIYKFDLQRQPVTVQGRTLFDLEKREKKDKWRTFEFFYRQVAVKTPLTDNEEETIPRIKYDRGYALLLGKWKLICDHRRKRQLFNLLTDTYEQKNVLQAHPEEAAEMFDMAKQIAEQQQDNAVLNRLSGSSASESSEK
jgi:arylsulfatase A-like enzyme